MPTRRLGEAAWRGERQNAYIGRPNRTYREEVLSAYLFDSLDEVREIMADWLDRYDKIRPHDALESLQQARYRVRVFDAEFPVFNCLPDRELTRLPISGALPQTIDKQRNGTGTSRRSPA